MNYQEAMKRLLWKYYGTEGSPAEWDGNVYGGGKFSQRFWEYFKMIEYLDDLTPYSVILDIGGGSPKTKSAFFLNLLLDIGMKVIVLDPEAHGKSVDQYQLIARKAEPDVLESIFLQDVVTHITCISVLEHMMPLERRMMFEAINKFFKGSTLALTFKYHPYLCSFEQQLTMQSLAQCLKPLDKMYLNQVEASPTHCPNAHGVNGIPLWYPLAMQFRG